MTCNKGALNPVHAADVDQFMPAWVHRAAPCVRASLHLVAKVGHFAPLFFRRFASLRYSFADLLRSYLWAASLRSDLLRTCFAVILSPHRSVILSPTCFAVILSPHRSAPTCFAVILSPHRFAPLFFRRIAPLRPASYRSPLRFAPMTLSRNAR